MPFTIPGLYKFPKEAVIIGRLLAGYSEIEYAVGLCLAAVLDDPDTMVRVLFRTRGEEQRLEIADALMRHKFDSAKLTSTYCEAMADAHWCRRIRNQFAHCLYDGHSDDFLRIVSLEDSAKARAGGTTATRIAVTPDLLKYHEEYFGYVQWCLFFLEKEYLKVVGKISSHAHSLPKKIARPPLNNATA